MQQITDESGLICTTKINYSSMYNLKHPNYEPYPANQSRLYRSRYFR